MADFKKMYFDLTGAVADAVEILIGAQQKGEEEYISSDETPIKLINMQKPDKTE